jgi:hypothetical protein
MATTTTHFPVTDRNPELDFLVTQARQGDDAENLQRLQRFVVEAATHPVRALYEAESSLNYQYIENDFYTAEELTEFAERGQPPTKRNEIAPIMERIAGQFIQTRQVATFLGRNTPADDAVGALAQDYLRWNDQQNQFEFEEQDLAWDGLIGGVGWLKSYIKTNEMGQPYECVRHVNPYHIFKDPYATRYDPNEDAKYICEGSWMDLEDLVQLFPEKEDEIREIQAGPIANAYPLPNQVASSLENEALTGTLSSLSFAGVGTRKRCRPFEVWYKRKVKVYHLFTADGVLAIPVPLDSKTSREIVRELGSRVSAQASYQDRMYTGVFLADLLIHHDVSAHHTNLFPYTPFYSGIRKNGAPLPISSRLVPINEAINKRESKSLAFMTNRQIIYEKSALEDVDAAQDENAKPDGAIEVRDGAISGQKIIFKDNLDMGQAQLALLQEDKDAIRRVSGQGNESMGMPSEVRSGTGIARKQMMGNLIITPVQNNLRRTRFMKARLSFAYMKQYMTEEMSFQITDDPKSVRTVQMTKGALQALKERTYDLVITEMKDYAVLREQQAEMLLTVLPQLATLGPGMVKLGIQMTEFRDKELLMQMVDQASQKGPEPPKMSLSMTWADLTPAMQAYYALTALQSPELAKDLLGKDADPAFLAKIKAELASTQVREGTRATIERGRLDLSAMQTAIEGRMAIKQLLEKRQQEPPTADSGAELPPAEGVL